MKKIIISLFLILGLGGWIASQHFSSDDPKTIIANPTTVTSTATSTQDIPSPSTNTGASDTAVSTAEPVPVASSKYKNGSYTGSVTDAYYGNIEVRAVISGGKITDVQFLQYPNDRRQSVEINSQAMPFLRQEAIRAQSAKVSGVSGATDTSRAFIESLTVALRQAA